MSKMKTVGSLLLAFSLVVTPAIINAETIEKDVDKNLINEEVQLINDEVDAVKTEGYISYEGNIADINKVNDNMSILAQKAGEKENPQEGIVFHINEDVLLLSDKTMDRVEKTDLKDGMKVLVFYKANTPMTLSLPPQMTPHGIVVLENEGSQSIKIAHFNDELTSMDNQLKLNIQKDTLMVDEDGGKVEAEDLKGENLLVFYEITTRSIPAQTNPKKVILLDGIDMDWDFGQDLNIIDRITFPMEENEDERPIKVLDNQLYKNEENVLMVPLREVGQALGYEVTWDSEKRAAELVKGAQWTQVVIGEGTVGEDNYSFAKMIVKLGTAPVLKNSTAYVPVNFIEEVLQMNISVEDGMLIIEK